MKNLSVVIVTKNEAHNIEDCIKSVHFADEVIVFDSGSTDDTVAKARALGAAVTITPDWPGDGPQKNRAINKASGKWVLCLDADERLSPLLANEIQSVITGTGTDKDAYDIPYQSTYCGKKIRFGDWRGESHIRLFQRDKARFTEDVVHCHLAVKGPIGKLTHKVIHHPFQHLGAMIYKMNDYSTQSAERLFKQGRKAHLGTAFGRGLWTFFRSYLLRLGFLDGKEGLLLAISNAQGTYYRYLKLMYLCQQSKKMALS